MLASHPARRRRFEAVMSKLKATCTSRIPDNCDSFECGRPVVRGDACERCLPGEIIDAHRRVAEAERMAADARSRLLSLEDPTDHAKRLVEIEARERAAWPAPWLWDRDDGSIETETGGAIAYVAHHMNMHTIARTGPAFSHSDADFIANAREDVPWLLAQLRAVSAALDAAGAPAGPLVERVRACTRDGGWRDQWEALRRAKDADDIARAQATRDVDILRRAAHAAAVSLGEVLPDDAGPEAIAAALRRATQARSQPTMLTVAIPDLGIVTAYGDTAQALAEDVASQVIHVVRTYALAAPESFAEDAIVLRAKVRAQLGLERVLPVVQEDGTAFFEQTWGAGRVDSERAEELLRGLVDEH